MRKLALIIMCLIFLAEAYLSLASMPVDVTMTGCVQEGTFTTEETDYGTHKVKAGYLIRVVDKERRPIDLKGYNGKRIIIKGYITPGDYLFADPSSIRQIGKCSRTGSKKLSIDEQERLAKELFLKMSKTDASDTKVFIELYGRVIEECPDTERAQVAYWRLTNLYLQAFDKPDYDRIASLLEEAVKRYPNTQATPHYKKRLLLAYEETRQWHKAVTLYEEAIKSEHGFLNDPKNAATMISYAEALIGSGNKAKAKDILKRVVAFGDRIEDWMLEIAKGTLKELGR